MFPAVRTPTISRTILGSPQLLLSAWEGVRAYLDRKIRLVLHRSLEGDGGKLNPWFTGVRSDMPAKTNDSPINCHGTSARE